MKSHAKAHPHEDPHFQHRPLTALLFVFVLLLGVYSVHETSTWLHIRTGADILARKAVPTSDTFSYTVTGRPWTTDSWLSDVLFHHLDSGSGPGALMAVKALLAASAFALLLPLNPSSPLLAAGVLGLGALAAWPGLTETPAMFSLLLLALLIRVLRPRRPFCWTIAAQVVIIEVLWANLDGAYAVLGLWLAGLKVMKTTVHAERGERLRFGALLLAALAGLALNPLGFSVVRLLTEGGSVTAWQFLSSWLNLYTIFVLAGLWACWICLQQEFFLSLTAASLMALSLVVPGLRPLYVLAACPMLTLALGHYLSPIKDTPWRMARLAAVMAGIFALHYVSVYLPLGRQRGYGAASLDGAVNYLKANGLAGRMFNEPESGDELVAAGGRAVFVDGRAGLYGPLFMKDAGAWHQRWRVLSDAYRFDYAVIINRRAAYPARALDEDPDWRLAYCDDAALVYVRRSGVDGWLVANLPKRLLAPNRLWPDALEALLSQPQRRAKVVEELDRWIVQAPDSVQALLWKAYAFDLSRLPQKAERLIVLARMRPRIERDPELMACLGFVLERRGRAAEALRLLQRSRLFARRARDRSLEAAVDLRLAAAFRKAGDEERARVLEASAKELSVVVEE